MVMSDDRATREQAKFRQTTSGGTAIAVVLEEASNPPTAAFHSQVATDTDPGVAQTLLTLTGVARSVSQAVVVCRAPGVFTAEVAGVIVGSGRTGAASPRAVFQWAPGFAIGPADTMELKFTARAGIPAAAIEAYLMGTVEP